MPGEQDEDLGIGCRKNKLLRSQRLQESSCCESNGHTARRRTSIGPSSNYVRAPKSGNLGEKAPGKEWSGHEEGGHGGEQDGTKAVKGGEEKAKRRSPVSVGEEGR